MLQQLGPALRAMIFLTLATGLLYPVAMTGLCQLLFPNQANGSLITKNGQVIGSQLIAQNFTKPEYFHPRPSNAGTDGYDASSSSGSNLGPTSQKLMDRIKASSAQFRKENPDFTGPIPADALTQSASGLDPGISLANAQVQAARVAKARGLDQASLAAMITKATDGRALGLFGEASVNVLELNLLLDQTAAPAKTR